MQNELQKLKKDGNYRVLKQLRHQDKFVYYQGKKLLNLASNDYLGLNSNKKLIKEFFENLDEKNLYFSSSSSRSLSGNYEIYEEFEMSLKSHFKGKEALCFNNGFVLNYSCLQALASLKNTVFLADKLIHASIIDGIKNSNFFRFRHNDMLHLESLLKKHSKNYENIVIISEALFSMDGDFAPLTDLISLKKEYKALLYIDEAHSFACFDKSGLGLAKEKALDNEIDFLVFTFGKALASYGACMLCSKEAKKFFINKARAFIYSTALAPITVAWSKFIFDRLDSFEKERKRLREISLFLKDIFNDRLIGDAYILSLLVGEYSKTDALAKKLFDMGFFAPAIKAPTVAKNSSRIRFSLNANIKKEDLLALQELF